MNPTRRNVTKAVATLALGGLSPFASAQEYPSKPIRLVVGYPPGGANDIQARQIAPRLAEVLGTPVVVDNKPGANAALGAEFVAKAAPDGYTLLAGGLTPLVLNLLTYKKLPYDPVKDFIGVSTVASTPILFAVRPGVAANSLAELVRLAKAKPGGLNFATTGTGGSTRVVLELLNQSAGVDIRYVPYKGAAPGITDLLGGMVDGMAVDFPVLYPFVKEGKLRGLAISSEARNPLLPELRTAAEQGMPELTCGNWSSLMVPAKTPRAIVERLHAAMNKVVRMPELRQQMLGIGFVPEASASPEAFSAFMQSEIARWGKVIKAAGVEAE